MTVQFAGSGSTGDRRRRRIVVKGEGTGVDSVYVDGDGADIESELVASAAAGPWVPASELRIWIYSALIGIGLGLLIFCAVRPIRVRDEIRPLTNLFFGGARPLAFAIAEVIFLASSAFLSHLIGWYRSRGKLDFSGRYRFWPWAVGLFVISAFSLATDCHLAIGQVVESTNLLPWRPTTVGWLLPVAMASLPIALFLDRDIRNSRTCLYTIRMSVSLWVAEAFLQIYRPELQSWAWFELSNLLLPLFASATMFVGLWLHARVVAYVCPDPPELDERSAWSLLVAATLTLAGAVAFWKWRQPAEVEESSPKRRRKKSEPEEAASKRKKRTPVKRPTSRRTRTKPAETESTDEQSEDASVVEQSESFEEPQNANEEQSDSNQWEEAEEVPVRQDSRDKGRYHQVHNSHENSVPAPHSRRQTPSWEDEAEAETQSNESESSGDSDDDDQSMDDGPALTADQMKGLSKRQKRELRKQLRDQQRARGR